MRHSFAKAIVGGAVVGIMAYLPLALWSFMSAANPERAVDAADTLVFIIFGFFAAISGCGFYLASRLCGHRGQVGWLVVLLAALVTGPISSSSVIALLGFLFGPPFKVPGPVFMVLMTVAFLVVPLVFGVILVYGLNAIKRKVGEVVNR